MDTHYPRPITRDYPLNEVYLLNPAHINAYDRFRSRGCEIRPPLFVDVFAYDSIDWDGEDVEKVLMESGLRFFWYGNVSSHRQLVLEFLSSLKMIWDYDSTIQKRRCTSWIFQIGNSEHVLDRIDMWRMLMLPADRFDAALPMVFKEDDRNLFWERITGGNHSFHHEGSSSDAIIFPHWKYIHRLVAMNINIRESEGRYVSKLDLDIMLRIYNGGVVDPMDAFGKYFVKVINEGYGGRVIGGGLLVTLIAQYCGFSVGKLNPRRNRFLDKAALASMGIMPNVQPDEGHSGSSS